MDKLISIKKPDKKNSIYRLVFEDTRGVRYNADMTLEDYNARMLKRKIVLEFNVPEKLVEDFEDAVRATVDENHSFGV